MARVTKLNISIIVILLSNMTIQAQNTTVLKSKVTNIVVSIPHDTIQVDTMIYGQMLEDCNDDIIYGGVVSKSGYENQMVTKYLKELKIPIMRYPGGTSIHEYKWENGVGPKDKRPVVKSIAWKGVDYNLFGTDEFLNWCKRIGTKPYINFNMCNSVEYGASLGDAINWLDYVNGSPINTINGMKRAIYGHFEPYNVKYWCIGNENYGPWGVHNKETADQYASKYYRWANTIKSLYSNLSLLGVGFNDLWNDSVLNRCGNLIDYLTLHFYINSKIKNGILLNPENVMFASARIENVLEKYEKKLVLANEKFRRKKEPIRFCIDEWNNRHLLYSGTKFELSRNDLRKLYDVEAISSMLNVFIRQSPYIGMANYIFPVNGHGLVVTTNEDDAFKTPPYYVFKLYREYMVGSKCDIEVKGPGISSVLLSDLEVDGAVENNIVHKDLCYIDGSAVLSYNNSINIAITNRSYNKTEKVKITIPENYNIIKGYFIESKDIYDCNTSKNRYKITPRIMKNPKLEFSISPCGFYLLHCERIN